MKDDDRFARQQRRRPKYLRVQWNALRVGETRERSMILRNEELTI